MPAAIETFDAQEPPERPFREIAALTYSGVLGDYPDVVRQFKIKARELGANAIILEDPVTYTGERHPYEHMLFRATAIAYQDRGATASR